MECKLNGTMVTAIEGAMGMDGVTATVMVTASMIGATATVMDAEQRHVGDGDG